MFLSGIELYNTKMYKLDKKMKRQHMNIFTQVDSNR